MESRKAWVVVWATFVCLAVIFGVSYSFAAFFENFATEFDAQRADVSWIFGICGLVYFVLGAFGGMLADRWGPRVVCMAGMGFIASGLYLTSLAQSLYMLYISYGLLVGLGIALVYTPSIASVQPWFTQRRGLASGIASSGVGAGTLVLPVVVSYLMTQMSWRDTLQTLSLGVVCVGLLAAYLLKRAPQTGQGQKGALPGLTLKEALQSPAFRWLYMGTLFGSPVMFIPFAHISAAARDVGVPEAQAVGLVGLIGIGSLVGRFAIGWLADRLGRVKTLMLMQCLMGLSYLIWAVADDRLVFALFAVWFGLSYGSIVSLLPAICMDLFGGKAVSAIIGTLYTGAALGNLLGPVLAGKVFDMSGAYTWVIWITLAIAAVATFSCWRILKYPQQPY
ncbi:MAG: putative MFS-type transporter YhjX [Pseudomonadota bacterium]|jgi:MFS family permease